FVLREPPTTDGRGSGSTKSIGETNPGRCMIAGARLATHRTIDARFLETRGEVWRQEQVVEPEACVALPALSHGVPECVDALAGMLVSKGIGPAAADQRSVCGTRLRLNQCILVPRLGGVDVEIGRRHIEIAR